MKKIKEILLTIIGVFFTVIFTPLVATIITWYLFPNIQMTFIQIMWIYFCIWMSLNFVTITIEKAIENNK